MSTKEERRALNQHVHRRHNGASLVGVEGGFINKLVEHELMHQRSVCDHEHDDYENPAVLRDLVKDA